MIKWDPAIKISSWHKKCLENSIWQDGELKAQDQRRKDARLKVFNILKSISITFIAFAFCQVFLMDAPLITDSSYGEEDDR